MENLKKEQEKRDLIEFELKEMEKNDINMAEKDEREDDDESLFKNGYFKKLSSKNLVN